MNLTITKRVIEVDAEAFGAELLAYVQLVKKHNPSVFGVTAKSINAEFGTKLKTTDFYRLADQLGLQVRRGTYINVDEIVSKFQK